MTEAGSETHPQAYPAPQPSPPARRSGGAEGNERLTAVTRLPRLLAAEAHGVALSDGQADGHAGAGRHARRAMEVLGGRGTRLALLTASLLGGLVIALLTVHLAGRWEPFG